MTIDPQDALASLRQWQLEQDNSGRFRVYRDQHGQIYHSVTHILKNTAPQSQKDALERWSQRAGSGLKRRKVRPRFHGQPVSTPEVYPTGW
jgi:hypothetical protein